MMYNLSIYFQLHAHEFNTNVALYDLYAYAVKYSDQVKCLISYLYYKLYSYV